MRSVSLRREGEGLRQSIAALSPGGRVVGVDVDIEWLLNHPGESCPAPIPFQESAHRVPAWRNGLAAKASAGTGLGHLLLEALTLTQRESFGWSPVILSSRN